MISKAGFTKPRKRTQPTPTKSILKIKSLKIFAVFDFESKK